MANGVKRLPMLRRPASEQEEERLALLESMQQTRLMLHQAYTGFNAVEDPDLIESYVYEINALQARYSYLLRRMRAVEEARQTVAAP